MLEGESFDQQSAAVRAYSDLVDTGFTGDLAVSQPGLADRIFYGAANPEEAEVRTIEGWPWASVTKQVIAVLVMREVEDGRLSLGSDVGSFVPALAGKDLSVEDLLRHRSGLPNPDDTPLDDSGVPSFYTEEDDPLAFCTSDIGEKPAPGEWSYNNCDYIVLGALLEETTGSSLDLLLAQGIGLDANWFNTSFLRKGSQRSFPARDEESAQAIAGYGAAGALVGPLDDLLLFDRALMDGILLDDDALARMWNGDPALGNMALGQWAFAAPLAGCENPVRIIERRGAIGKYQMRNIILPDRGIAVAIATDQPDYEFGEVWTGNGTLHDLLATLACGWN